MRIMHDFGDAAASASATLSDVVRAAASGVAGAVLTVKHLRSWMRSRSHKNKRYKQTAEVRKMKKSTVVALFAALAAVAGVLGALYVYVLRREKELDEYEQLLFSEDFNDDISDEDLDDLLEAVEGGAEE